LGHFKVAKRNSYLAVKKQPFAANIISSLFEAVEYRMGPDPE
jgi:hypothetical protein